MLRSTMIHRGFLLVLFPTAAAFMRATSQPHVAFASKRLIMMTTTTTSQQAARIDLTGEKVIHSPDNISMYSREKEQPDLPTEELLDSNKDDSPKYCWEKEKPKRSLEYVGKSHTASQLILNAVESVHWFAVVPSFVSSYAIMKHIDVWFGLFDGDALRVVMWLLAPMVSMCAGLAPIVAHIYEDWQISPAVDPDSMSYQSKVYGDERLREIAYSLLFTGLGIASMMNFVAYQGCSMANVIPTIGLLIFGAMGDKRHLVSDYVTSFFTEDGKTAVEGIKVLPVPVSIMVFFVVSQILAFNFALLPLASQVDGNLGLKMAILLPQMFATAGGMLEGCGAEVKFDQRYHFIASLIMSLGVGTQAWSYLQLGQYLS